MMSKDWISKFQLIHSGVIPRASVSHPHTFFFAHCGGLVILLSRIPCIPNHAVHLHENLILQERKNVPDSISGSRRVAQKSETPQCHKHKKSFEL